MSKHTPGPWLITGSMTKYIEARIGGGMLQEVAACGPTEADGGYGAQQMANAKLIAAAPDLLEALEAMIVGACAVAVHHAGERATLQMAVDMATKVIARAKGEPQ